jgi:NADPH:quinone reductase-like Zn-dependent oxidoreductase/malonyl CoA-acyl carrier protein transacylase/NAD(P)-dependent dehydrogenase (short-subunit alcohol dehydrogenase family)
VEYALAEMWRAFGVSPQLMIGHSIGEFAAAVQAGVMDLADAARLVAARGRLMRALCPEGAMLALTATVEQAEAIAGRAGGRDEIALAALNGPQSIVLSGAIAAIEKAAHLAEEAKLRARRLEVSHAFHSPLMEPMLEAFREVASTIAFRPASAEIVSTVTGRKIGAEEMSSPDYWVRQIREPVRYAAAATTAASFGIGAWLEAGPQPVLLGMASAMGAIGEALAAPSLSPKRDEIDCALAAAGELWRRGVAVDWRALDEPWPRGRARLPGAIFERRRFWPDVGPALPELTTAARVKPSGKDVFPGKRIVSPHFPGAIYAISYDRFAPTFLDDHRIYSMIVVPGAAHLSMALTAVAAQAPGAPLRVSGVAFSEVLVVPDDETREIQLGLKPEGAGDRFEVHSSASETDDWILHASGAIEALESAPARAEPFDIEAVRARCSQEVASTEIFYQLMHRQGIQLGRQFQWVEKLWRGEREALGFLRAPERGDEAETYFLAPGLLDSMFQSMGATLSTKELEAGAYIPIAIEKLTFHARPEGRLRNHVRLRDNDPARPDARVSDMVVMNEQGEVLVEVQGLRIHRAPREALRRFAQRHLRDALYAPIWSEQPTPERKALTGQRWLALAPAGADLAALSARMTAAGAMLIVAAPGYDPLSETDIGRVVADCRREAPLDGVLHLHAGQAGAGADAGVYSLLALVRALDARRREGLPKIAIVTRGLHCVLPDEAGDIADLGLDGLGRVCANEYPETAVLRLDLPKESAAAEEAEAIVCALESIGEEDEIAIRGGRFFAPRLRRWADGRHGAASVDVSRPFQLIRAETGVLEEMKLVEVERPAPGEGEIEIASEAAGLNFRDVLNALAVYPGDAGPMGGEVVGRVTAVGADVTGFAVGDMAMAIGAGTFARHVVTKAAMARRLAEGLSPLDAATIPVAYVSAWLGLVEMAGLKAGESVLIHAAAGGVGMAAVQIARHIGAVVHATAGSDAKRALLADMGVTHIYSSRDLAFAEGVLAATGGQGVDVVLNSLAGDFIAESVRIAAKEGRFVEIGKRDTLSHERMAELRPDIAYHKMALDEIIVGDPAHVGRMLGAVCDLIEAGRLTPLPRDAFPIAEAVEAFRFMAQAKHVGKVVLSFPSHGQTAEEEAPFARPDRAYLVTGGYGAIGLKLAERLARAGAGRIALLGRSGPQRSAQEAIEALRAGGTEIVELTGDVTDAEALAVILARLRGLGLPIGGVFHAAGALDDAPIAELTPERFAKALDGKLVGARALHAATLVDPIEHFVLFSSAAAIFGTPGQANYAAANAGLDLLAHHRRARGLPALSVNWGPWADGGMAHGVASGVARLWGAMGIAAIQPKAALDTLELLMQSSAAQALVLTADWDKMAERFPTGRPPRPILDLLSANRGGGPTPEWQALLARLSDATPSERTPMMVAQLRAMAAKVLGRSAADAPDPMTPLNELGLDSLMAVEFANQLTANSGLKLRVTDLFDHPTIAGLSAYLIGLAFPEAAAEEDAFAEEGLLTDALLNSVAGLSDEEAEELLRRLEKAD